jgi:ribonuclease HI
VTYPIGQWLPEGWAGGASDVIGGVRIWVRHEDNRRGWAFIPGAPGDGDLQRAVAAAIAQANTPRTIECWTDGSGTHDPDGPACIGVTVFVDGRLCVEASEHVGDGTNQLAELRAIRRALWLARELLTQHMLATGVGDDVPAVVVRTDSQYAIDMVFLQRYEPRAHAGLITAMRSQVAELQTATDVVFAHVEGHSGVFGNERADWLAGEARRRHLASKGVERRKKREPWPPPAAGMMEGR